MYIYICMYVYIYVYVYVYIYIYIERGRVACRYKLGYVWMYRASGVMCRVEG